MSKLQAKDLKYNKSQIMKIDRWIKDIISLIDDVIKETHEQGKYELKYSLPLIEIENLTSAEVRRKIHSNIISDLDYRGFLVHYTKENKKYYLTVTWITDEEIHVKEAEIQILQYHSLPIKNKGGKSQLTEVKPDSTKYNGIKSLINSY